MIITLKLNHQLTSINCFIQQELHFDIMPQGVEDKNVLHKSGRKDVISGTIRICSKSHSCMKKCTILPILGAMPLYCTVCTVASEKTHLKPVALSIVELCLAKDISWSVSYMH